MTTALCFNCGALKHGAITPCPKCGVKSSGKMDLDIVFSDHYYDVQTLREFGGVIRAIEPVCADPTTRFWAFLQYISEHHAHILKIDLDPAVQTRVTDILRQVVLPPVTLRESLASQNRTRSAGDNPSTSPS